MKTVAPNKNVGMVLTTISKILKFKKLKLIKILKTSGLWP